MSIDVDRRISRSRLNRLGQRIRRQGLTAKDGELLELLLSDAFDGLTAVSDVLRAEMPDVSFTPRLKTIGTIVDKLERERTMAFSRMRDIAGIRIVEEMNRVEQDVMVQQIAETLGRAKILDRRRRPSFGYRAVHLEVDCRGCYVEVQVRTGLQDKWAQIVERLADSWGRQVRYGGDPPDPEHEIIPDFTRRELWSMVQDVAEHIDAIESADASIASAGATVDETMRIGVATDRRQMASLLERMQLVVTSGRV